MPTTGHYSHKRYGCSHCGNISTEGTNHWGEMYSRCKSCSWRRPMEATVKVCLELMPDGFTEPEPWPVVRLGDIAEVLFVKRVKA